MTSTLTCCVNSYELYNDNYNYEVVFTVRHKAITEVTAVEGIKNKEEIETLQLCLLDS